MEKKLNEQIEAMADKINSYYSGSHIEIYDEGFKKGVIKGASEALEAVDWSDVNLKIILQKWERYDNYTIDDLKTDLKQNIILNPKNF